MFLEGGEKMNNKVIIGIVVLVIIVGAFLLMKSQYGTTQQQNMPSQTQTNTITGTSTTANNAVTIQNMAFSPATLTVKVGDKVTWTNQDTVGHSATADDASFDTGVLAQGQSGSATFTKAGTYAYHCKVHPSMQATIIVQ